MKFGTGVVGNPGDLYERGLVFYKSWDVLDGTQWADFLMIWFIDRPPIC
jgi:hypothetical protein